jgi:hypothetical protein
MVAEGLLINVGKNFRNSPKVLLQADFSEGTTFHTEFWQHKIN